jgi:nicotinate-nucleotide adenylyltransferase
MTIHSQTQDPNLLLFGGTFDPPHIGHRNCIEFAILRFPQAEIQVVPSLVAPRSRSEIKSSSASFEDRMEMCRIAFGGLSKAPLLRDLEKNLATPNYTVQTLEYIRKQYPKKRLGFLIGLDQFYKFHLWMKPLRILELASLIVISRDKDENVEGMLREFAAKLGISILKLEKNQVGFDGYLPLFFISNRPISASSTEIRQMLNDEKPISSSTLDPKVLDYIREKNLYTR